MAEDKNVSGQTVDSYGKVITRLEKSIAKAENQSWETLKDEVDKAVEFEQGVANLTKEEASLLSAYVKRDVSQLLHFVSETGKGLREWLRFDLDLLESKLRKTLLSIADKTTVDLDQLERRLHHDVGTYVAGEVACPGVLRCNDCGKMVCLVETTHIDSCHKCEGIYFQRVTSRWPSEPEIDSDDVA